MKRPTILQRLEYGSARFGIFALTLLPERFAYGMLAVVARGFLMCSRSRMRLGVENARRALGDEIGERQLRQIVQRGTVSAFQNALDMVWGIRLQRRGRLQDRLDIQSLTQAPVEAPLITCTGHLGSWEMGAVGVALAFGESHVIGRVPKNPLIAEFLRRQREAGGLIVHPRRGGVRPVARALARNKVAVQAVDQNQRLRGIFVPYFGKLASTERSAATLAVRRGYPVLIGLCLRLEGRFLFRIDVLPPIRAETTGDPEEDVAAMATRINAALETLVRCHPEQYLWIHDRYRTRPTDEDEMLPVDAEQGRETT